MMSLAVPDKERHLKEQKNRVPVLPNTPPKKKRAAFPFPPQKTPPRQFFLDKRTTSCYILIVNNMLYIKEEISWSSRYPTQSLKS